MPSGKTNVSFVLQVHSVENFVCSVNAHLTTRQENERLKGIMARIESYDVVVCLSLFLFSYNYYFLYIQYVLVQLYI